MTRPSEQGSGWRRRSWQDPAAILTTITHEGKIMAESTLRALRCEASSDLDAGSTAPLRSVAMNGPELLEHAAGLVTRRRREYGEPVDCSRRSPSAGRQSSGRKSARRRSCSR